MAKDDHVDDNVILDLHGGSTSRVGQSAALRGTDAGVCSGCQKLKVTLVNGRCTDCLGGGDDSCSINSCRPSATGTSSK